MQNELQTPPSLPIERAKSFSNAASNMVKQKINELNNAAYQSRATGNNALE